MNQDCLPGKRNERCCPKLSCGEGPGAGDRRCCRPPRGFCDEESECCGELGCFPIAGIGAEPRCCIKTDRGDCTGDTDCCGNLTCNTTTGRCEGK